MEEQGLGDNPMVEVRGVADMPTDILTLYFENKRRSGGGKVLSIKQDGDHAVITFENPADAQQVISKPEHKFQDVHLIVKRVPPNDPRAVVLRDLSPDFADDILTLFLEYITGLDGEGFTVHFSPDRTQAAVHFRDALPAPAVEEMKRKAEGRCLHGVTVQVEQLPHTDRVLVENLGPSDDEELMRLYFESRRSNGGTVLDVTMLPGAKAIVEFQEWEDVERVVQKKQILQQRELLVRPYYSFLHPSEDGLESEEGRVEGEEGRVEGEGGRVEGEEPPTQASSMVTVPDALRMQVLQSSGFLQELQAECPDRTLEMDSDGVIHVRGSVLAQVQKGKSQILEFLNSVAQVEVAVGNDLATFLSGAEVRDHLQSLLKERSSCYSISDLVMTVCGPSLPVAREAAGLIEQQVSKFSVSVTDQQLHALTSPEWEKLLPTLRCCNAQLTDAGDQVWFTSLAPFQAENQQRVELLLREAILQESVIAMEPGKFRYLQEYHQDLLMGYGEVSIFPLEGDVSGLRVTGQAKACQTMDELLRSIIATICSRPVALQEPGISRFLLEPAGTDTLRQLERKYKCTIRLERACWITPQAEHPLEAQRNQGIPRLERGASVAVTQLPVLEPSPVTTTEPNANVPDLDEIRSLLASITDTDQERISGDAITTTSQNAPDVSESDLDDEDIYTDQQPSSCFENEIEEGVIDNEDSKLQDGDGNNNGACGFAAELMDADDPQLCLALQYSMDSRLLRNTEEEDFQKAIELSKMAVSPDGDYLGFAAQMTNMETSEARFEEAIKMSKAEAIRTSNSAQLTIYGSAEVDFNKLVRELERKIRTLVCKKSIEHSCFQNLCGDYKSYLEYLQRKHAVTIVGQGSEVIIHGFAGYVLSAVENVTQLIQWVVQDEADTAEEVTLAESVQWVRHSRQGVAIPYTLKANAFIEESFQRKQKKVDVTFDNKPYIIDFEQMKEYDVGATESLQIERKPLNSLTDVGTLPLAFGSVELTELSETTEEYTTLMAPFFKTLKDLYDKLDILKVEVVNNPLLYQQYMVKKASMVATQTDVERVLFHGTSEESAKEIYVHGFNRSFCGKNAAVYGQGVYFAGQAIVSVDDQYSPPNPDGLKFVFAVKVLTGSYTKGDGKLKIPPLKDSSQQLSLRYDSVVDDCEKPRIFVVFHDTQAYPQYLITCRWKKPPAKS
ncbi:protein mono-ADP-ribosyltransferase PARP10 isoform X2 [Rhinoraja longicauda]